MTTGKKIQKSVPFQSILGANVRFPALLDQSIASEMAALADPQDDFKTIKGKTYCTDSFYDGKLNFFKFSTELRFFFQWIILF